MTDDAVDQTLIPTCAKCISCVVCRVRASFMLILKDMGKDAPINEDDLARICTQYRIDILVSTPVDTPEKDEPTEAYLLQGEDY
jgi:hypothetical protein